MGFFDDIGNSLKSAVTAVGDAANTVVGAVGDAAGWTADVVGEGVEGVTRVLAGDEAADAVKKTFDENIEPGIKRGVEGVANIIATPITAIDDVLEKGIIDGITSNTLESTQDIIGGVTRTVAGKNVEQSFDKVYDEQIQGPAELALGTAARIGLMFVPGGQFVLAADAASEFTSLGYRAITGEQLGVADYVGAGASVLALGGGAAMGAMGSVATKLGITAAAKTATNAVTTAATKVTGTVGATLGFRTAATTIKATDDVAVAGIKAADDVAVAGIKAADDVAVAGIKATDDIAFAGGNAPTTLQATREAAIGELQVQVEEQAQNQVTLAIEREIQKGQAQNQAALATQNNGGNAEPLMGHSELQYQQNY